MIYDDQDDLSCSSYHVCVKVAMRMWDIRFGLIGDVDSRLFLDDGTGVAVLIQLVQNWL